MTPDAVAVLLLMQGATNIHDAHGLAVDAVKAGATSEQVRAAINQWMSLQRQQVQVAHTAPIRCDACDHGPSVHSGGYGSCFQRPCTCEAYVDPVAASMERHLAGKALPESGDVA